MVMSEVGIFSVASLMMGWLGTDQLAAHAVALQCAALAFMVPLGLSQATTVRVGRAFGAGSTEGVRKAGWMSLALAVAFMSSTCLLFLLFPNRLVALFLDPTDPKNAAALGFAAAYLGIAALFQLVDGAQVIAAATLRGLSDTAVPMVVAMIGYWALGLPIAYVCGFVLNWQGVGIWLGLASGLAFVAVVLTSRFAMRERLRLLRAMPA
jgi:MATE family multidrug resistance protein